jgi:hypothetical protein
MDVYYGRRQVGKNDSLNDIPLSFGRINQLSIHSGSIKIKGGE